MPGRRRSCQRGSIFVLGIGFCDRKHNIKDHTAMNISGRKTNCQHKPLAIDMLSRQVLALTVIQLRRFMLRFVVLDFCASAIDARLNSYYGSASNPLNGNDLSSTS
jgi:hypothetical protein